MSWELSAMMVGRKKDECDEGRAGKQSQSYPGEGRDGISRRMQRTEVCNSLTGDCRTERDLSTLQINGRR